MAQPIPVDAPVMTTDCMVGPFNIIANGLFDLAQRDDAKGQVLQGLEREAII